MIQWLHVKTSSHRFEACGPGTGGAGPSHERERTARRPSGPLARFGPYHLGRNGGAAGRGPCQRTTTAAAIPRRAATQPFPPRPLGWSAPGADDAGRRKGFPGALGRTSAQRGRAGGLAPTSGVSRKAGPESRTLGGVPPVGAAWVAESGARHRAPEKRSGCPGGMGKNSQKRWQPCGLPKSCKAAPCA